MANEICDNCDKIKDLVEINYLTRRQKVKIILCKECLDQFAEMVVELAEPEEAEHGT
jgi:protein-arginine kinase activator protein McsA